MFPSSKSSDISDKLGSLSQRVETFYEKMVAQGTADGVHKLTNVVVNVDSKKLVRLDFIANSDQEKKFLAQKESFRQRQIPVEEKLMFHGTDASVVDKILAENFVAAAVPVAHAKRSAYGKGTFRD